MHETARIHCHSAFRSGTRGFTLIELMIVVAIVAVIAAVAMPSFFGQIRQSRRSEAVAALAQIQQGQERWRANNPAYTSTLSETGVTYANTRPGNYYALSTTTLTSAQTCANGTNVTCAIGSCYSATAVANSGTSQASDSGCTTLTSTWVGPCGELRNAPVACWKR